MSDDPKKLVTDGYDVLHDVYAGWESSQHGLRWRHIDRVFELGLALPATALDLACGTGRHATAYLVTRGLDVTGLDLSPKSVKVARAQVPGARFLVGDMASIRFPPGTNRRLVVDSGLDLVDADIVTTVEDGRRVRFPWIIARKP